MRECFTYGSVRGAARKGRPYRDRVAFQVTALPRRFPIRLLLESMMVLVPCHG